MQLRTRARLEAASARQPLLTHLIEPASRMFDGSGSGAGERMVIFCASASTLVTSTSPAMLALFLREPFGFAFSCCEMHVGSEGGGESNGDDCEYGNGGDDCDDNAVDYDL